MHKDSGKYADGRLLARNALWSLAGQCLPIAVALFSIPPLVRGLGADRFGILSLGWAVIGYFGFFEFGLGRALTKVAAERLGAGRDGEVRDIFRTALLLTLVLGAAGMASMAALSPLLVDGLLAVPGPLRDETLDAFYILSFSVPVATATSAFGGVLEAHQRFRQLSYVRTLTGILNFAGPLAVLHFGYGLPAVMAVLVLSRAAALALYARMALSAMPAGGRGSPGGQAVRPLLRLGGWMTVSSVISPFMVYLDRFFIGSTVSVAAVAWYATPYEAVTKLWIIPGAVMSVMFPAFSACGRDPSRRALLYGRAVKCIFIVMFPPVLLAAAFAREGLALWVGPEIAEKGAGALRWLAAGVFINSVARVPYNLVQGCGRADLTAKLHLAELPLYFAMLWLFAGRYGITGVAAAWTLRHVVELSALLLIAGRLNGRPWAPGRKLAWGAGAAALLSAAAALDIGLAAKCAAAALALSLFGLVSWFAILAPEERAWCRMRP